MSSKLYVQGRYGTIPVSILNNPDLSAKAKGLWAYLQSKPDGWRFAIDRIAKDFKDGKDSIRSGLQELEEAGYLRRKPCQDEQGRFAGYDYILAENPSTENPTTGKPSTENPDTISKKDISKKEKVKKRKIIESAPQSNPSNPSPANSQSTKIPDLPPDIGTVDDWLSWSLEDFRAVWKRHGKQLERSHPRYAGVLKYIGAHLKYLGTTPSPVVVERLVNMAAPDYWITGAVDEMIATLRNGGDPKNFNLERFYRTLRKYEQMNLPTDRNPYKYLEERRQERKEDAVKL